MSSKGQKQVRPNTVAGTCPSCGANMESFYAFHNVPVNSCIQLSTLKEARNYPRGDIILGFCNACGFICNLAFVSELAEYSGRYEETQGYSPTFQRFHHALAQELVERYKLHDKSVLEIGCGKAEFLALLCKLGPNRGLGFDPGYDENRGVLQDMSNIRVIKDFYSEKYNNHKADFVCCKMTLEHIQDTAKFVNFNRQAMCPNQASVLYMQVPESLRIIRDCAFEDIYYEHCSYFTMGSLVRLFRAQGLDVLRVYTEYEEQYLAIEARLADKSAEVKLQNKDDLVLFRDLVDSFPERCKTRINEWQASLEELASSGPVVLWGSGSKAVSFLSTVDIRGLIKRVVDINPYRQKHYMPGTAQAIIAPQELLDDPPVAVIIMNPVYRGEITESLHQMGLSPQILTL